METTHLVVHQKSIRARGWPEGIREVHVTTTTVGPSTAIHLEFGSPDNVSEKRNRGARPETVRDRHLRRRCPSVTGDADRRFCPLPGVRELHWAAIRSDERPASPYLVRYEFCRRDNSEHIRG